MAREVDKGVGPQKPGPKAKAPPAPAAVSASAVKKSKIPSSAAVVPIEDGSAVDSAGDCEIMLVSERAVSRSVRTLAIVHSTLGDIMLMAVLTVQHHAQQETLVAMTARKSLAVASFEAYGENSAKFAMLLHDFLTLNALPMNVSRLAGPRRR